MRWALCRNLLAICGLVFTPTYGRAQSTPGSTATAKKPSILFLIAEPEYHTKENLTEFAQAELTPRGVVCNFAFEDPADTNSFVGLEKLAQSDLLFVSVRRHAPRREQLEAIRRYIASGKPVAGIRTASHAFGAKPLDPQHEGWETFDADVLGGSYGMHYGRVPAEIQVVVSSLHHPVLQGLHVSGFTSATLYKNPTLAPTAQPLLVGWSQGETRSENVAWVNTNQNRRVFYTSLGTPDDFKGEPFRQLLLNGIYWALDRGTPQPPQLLKPMLAQAAPAASHSGPLSPAESAKKFHVPDDLEIDQVLSEPIVAQPVFLNFDERGRMWVVQYRQYPNPAGLKMVSHDSVWRSVYDKVPLPPPHGVRGLDRITIHESTHHDGIFDSHKTFVDGLNIATAVERGRGGVWVLNPPYLLFYPDANDDDIPDGDPVVHLAGFGLEDTHSVVNSLRWGPDGWLYGAQGSTVTSHIIRPGLDKTPIVHTMGQLIWRYHPESHRFEVFSEGGGNAFGLEMDEDARIFSGHNGGDTRGFHYMQGAYLQKGFEKHGPLSNPYAYGYFPPMDHPAVERFTHNFITYAGGALPERHNHHLFGVEPLQGRVVESEITATGSTFKTRDLEYAVRSDDPWFRPVDIKVGPDGAIYVCDWYDQQVNHYRNHEGQIDTSNGRIYRIRAKGAKPGEPFDLRKMPSAQFLTLLSHPNKWFRQTALRLIADRRDRGLIEPLMKQLAGHAEDFHVESLWALYLSGGFDADAANIALNHPDPQVRLWAVRLLCDDNQLSRSLAEKITSLASSEPNIESRAQLACSARRLPAADDLAIVKNLLLHDEDASDPRLPLLIWWAIESKAASDRDQVVKLFEDVTLWSHPIVRNQIMKRLIRRYAEAGTQEDFRACARLFVLAPDADAGKTLLAGFEEAFQGRTVGTLPENLIQAMSRFQSGSVAFELRRGNDAAVETALKAVANASTRAATRLEYIGILGQAHIPRAVPVLLGLVEHETNAIVLQATLNALPSYDDSEIGRTVTSRFDQFSAETRKSAETLLASRSAWARQWLEAILDGKVKSGAVSPNTRRTILSRHDPALEALMIKAWGQPPKQTTAEMETQIQRLIHVVEGGTGDPYNGRTLFMNTCGPCHTLFGKGGQIGPDLTTYKRDDLATMLLNIVNPSAEIREGFENYILETKDDRSLNGFLVERNAQTVVLRGLDGQNVAVESANITRLEATGVSIMPEGLLDPFKESDVRDLFAYLRSTQPLVGNPPPR